MLCLKLAEEIGVIVPNQWVSWFKAACLPGLVSLLLTPFILYYVYPPEMKNTPEAPSVAKKRLEEMGPVKREEWVMIVTMLLAVALWISGYEVSLTLHNYYIIFWNCPHQKSIRSIYH